MRLISFRTTVFCTLLTLFMLAAHGQTATAPDQFQSLQFLVGTWSGEGKSDSGAIVGTVTFRRELQGHVLVRQDSSTFPKQTAPSKPYEQMMVISPSLLNTFRANYWDSVGHVIEYIGGATHDGGSSEAQFLSVPLANSPQFRLTYTATSPNRLHTVFEIEPPGSTIWHTVADGYSVKVVTKSGV